ncbi:MULTISPECIES: DUF4177 domain-containing protein [Neobacillus]|uniref:DUF4177 domain-containing protein n=1 Tax=Neobacillus rhizophilus TaxID=2833579 RepID=A0A942YXF1_9BACI|nr:MULTISPECIES: DUF4177 domain-containing protein [Neobacillus]MBS4213751.1 DUF4177 domain-containing protein [Neobacillus rhizophilus]MBU8917845.1 DUF4177 domain-containing protein [Bacillus sp. FJAT-29953]
MYEYKFERIELSKLSGKPKEDYHEIIQQNAKNGWRLVQIFAPGIAAYGSAAYYEAIFERKVD